MNATARFICTVLTAACLPISMMCAQPVLAAAHADWTMFGWDVGRRAQKLKRCRMSSPN